LLALLVARAVQRENLMWSPGKVKIIAILFVSVSGLSDELYQAFVPARFASALAFFAD